MHSIGYTASMLPMFAQKKKKNVCVCVCVCVYCISGLASSFMGTSWFIILSATIEEFQHIEAYSRQK